MTLQLGRKGFIGLGKEATPGVPVAPTVYLPFNDQSLQEKHDPIADISAKGIREQQYGSVVGKQWGEGSFSVNLDANLVGHLLLGLLGTVSSTTVAGSVKDHLFTRNNSNTPQTYTLNLSRGVDQKMYPYATFKSGELQFSDGLASFKVDVISQDAVTTNSGTLTVTSGIILAWKDATVGFSTTISGAQSATPTKVSELTLTIENNSVPSFRSGSAQPATIDHGFFRVHGSFKLFFEDTTQLDNFMTLTKQSMVIAFNGRGIGSGLSETLTIRMPKIRLQEAVVDTPNDDFNVVVCTFEAEFDGTPGLVNSIDVILRNATASY